MLERSHSFEIRDKNYNDIQEIMENVLKQNLSLTIDSKRLGSSLIRINYTDSNFEEQQQKNNRITILQEPGKRVYIQINGRLTAPQVDEIWNELEKKLNNSTYIHKTEKLKPLKEGIIREIKDSIEIKGYIVKDEEITRFIENFIEEYDRLPKKNEFPSIVRGYMIMANEDYLQEKTETSIKNEIVSQSIEPDLDLTKNDIHSASIIDFNSTMLIENSGGRRKCPSCGNEGIIHEMNDKSVILMDYPKIYGKKLLCGQCSYEWRKK